MNAYEGVEVGFCSFQFQSNAESLGDFSRVRPQVMKADNTHLEKKILMVKTSNYKTEY